MIKIHAMLKYIFISLLIFPSLVFAQLRKGHSNNHEQIESQFIAHITSQLNLTADEAKVFWPIYDGYKQKKDALERPPLKNQDTASLTEEDAVAMLNNVMKYEEDKHVLKKELYADLAKEFSSTRLLALLKAEHSFKKKMFDKVRRRPNN